jgi:transmembrane sensor
VNATASEPDDAIVQAADWSLRLEAAPGDTALTAAFERWLEQSEAHRTAYRMVRYTSATLDKGSRELRAGEAVGRLGENRGVRLPARKPRRVRWLAATAALAAAVLAFVTFPLLQKHILADYVTGVAELREIMLPDGSVAFLDAGSAIAVNFSTDAREITLLSGQAFFDVVRNSERPFKVGADKVSVVVTGTAFGVNKTLHAVSVAVQSGTVEVALSGRPEKSRLSGGESWAYDRKSGTVSRGEVQPANVALWRSRRLVVHNAVFEEILEEIGRHMPGAIVVRDRSLNRQMVSGVYDLSRPPEALEALAGSQRARLTQLTPYLVVISAR